MISLKQAKELRHGTIIYHMKRMNVDGSPERWAVNGKVKTWKTRPHEIQVPLKHGLWSFDYLSQENLDEFALTEEEAMEKKLRLFKKDRAIKVLKKRKYSRHPLDKHLQIVLAEVKFSNSVEYATYIYNSEDNNYYEGHYFKDVIMADGDYNERK